MYESRMNGEEENQVMCRMELMSSLKKWGKFKKQGHCCGEIRKEGVLCHCLVLPIEVGKIK